MHLVLPIEADSPIDAVDATTRSTRSDVVGFTAEPDDDAHVWPVWGRPEIR